VPILDLFWTILIFYAFFIWIMLLVRVFGDIFRSDMSGGGKALWVFFVIIVPFLGVLIYLIAHGGDMQKRAIDQAAAQQQSQADYIRSAAGTGTSTADELEKLADLHQDGVLNDAEYTSQKQKILNS
jgi:ABC-type multidrug transport system fused ATPase/permease subunit